jgi:hypothetical protein
VFVWDLVVCHRQEVETVKKQHDWLVAEAQKTDDEIGHYEKYMQSKTVREQSKIQAINDMQNEELKTLAAERLAHEQKFAKSKHGMLYQLRAWECIVGHVGFAVQSLLR